VIRQAPKPILACGDGPRLRGGVDLIERIAPGEDAKERFANAVCNVFRESEDGGPLFDGLPETLTVWESLR
jgi:hypothetical protein